MENKKGPWDNSELTVADLVKHDEEHRKTEKIAIIDGDKKEIHPET